MCKLLVGVNKKPDNAEFQKYITAQAREFPSEKDGMSAVVITFDGKLEVARSLNNYDKVYEMVRELLPKARFVSIHSRTGTSGLKNDNNVHFFEDKNYLFAHNGFVRGFTSWGEGTPLASNAMGMENAGLFMLEDKQTSFFSKKTGEFRVDNGKCWGCSHAKVGVCSRHKREGIGYNISPHVENPLCDSFLFLKSLDKPIKKLAYLDAQVEMAQFFGFGVLIGKKVKDVWLLVQKDITAIVDDSFTLFTSYKPDKSYSIAEEELVCGVSLVSKKEVSLPLEHRKVFEGVYRLDY